jgi:glycosyltransferase involved in cell wall biosynthesis
MSPTTPKRPLRLCLLTREYAEDTPIGGIGRIVNMQAKILAAAGVEVHVITLAASGRTHYVEDGVHVHRYEPSADHYEPDQYYLSLARWSKTVADAFAELDARTPIDVVDTPDYSAESLHLPLRDATALVTTLHGTTALVEAPNLIEAPSPGRKVHYDLEFAGVRRSDLVIAPTEAILRDTYALMGGEGPPARVLPHAFDPARFPVREPRRPASAVRRLLFTGRVEGRKGVDFAVRAAAAVAARGYETELIVAGRDWSGYRRRVLEPLMDELGFTAVRYLGEVAERRVGELLREADCVIMPSRQENFHMAANEALASGTPVITSDVNGVTCWYEPEHGMLALPLDDPERFGELAADAIADEDWLAEAGVRGAERVRTLLAPARVGEELVKVYREAIAIKVAASGAAPVAAAAAGPVLGEGPVRGHAVLGDAAELEARPDLLGAYAAAVGPQDDATLVVVGTPAQAGSVAAALAAIAASGGAAPHAVARTAAPQDARFVAALSEAPRRPGAVHLPQVGVASAAALRELLTPALEGADA